MKRSPLRRKARLAPVNRKRKAAAFKKNFGLKAAWIRERDCAVAFRRPLRPLPDSDSKTEDALIVVGWLGLCAGPVEAAHAKTRGAGGTAADLVPLCQYHHRRQHMLGIKTFGARYGVDLAEMAESYDHAWEHRDA